jgi:hypothetical protein
MIDLGFLFYTHLKLLYEISRNFFKTSTLY